MQFILIIAVRSGFRPLLLRRPKVVFFGAQEGFNDWGGRGYDDFVPGEVTKTAPSGDETT